MMKKQHIILAVIAVIVLIAYFGFKYYKKSQISKGQFEYDPGNVYTVAEEVLIQNEINTNKYNREEAIQILVASGKIKAI